MDITVSARHMDISAALRAAAEEKIGRLSRFEDGILRAEVHFSEERNPRIPDKEVCEVTMEGGGHHVRCKVSAADPFAAIDLAVEQARAAAAQAEDQAGPAHAPGPSPCRAVAVGAEDLDARAALD